ncbi:MAG: hypothetical protein ACLQGP_37010 [Isosphaeraceae bacterium]
MKCPKCGLRFALTVADASSESTLGGPANADWLSRVDLETQPPAADELPVSLGDHDLRETFDLPLMSGRDAERAGAAPEPAVGDAASLLDEPAPKRRKTAAESRLTARRCSGCGGYVPQGMSVCMSCGLDQETGLRVGIDDDLIPPPPPRPQGPPLHVAIMGGLCGTAGLIFLIMSLVRSGGGAEGWQNYGWLCLAVVSGFAILASVQFIRGKSVKLLMLALTLGVVVDVLALVAMPLIQANFEDPEQIVKPIRPNDPDSESDIVIKPFEERIDPHSISLGITFLLIYAILSLYLMSTPVKKYIHSRADR